MMKILGIDASNIRAGGGLTHLKEVLRNADPIKYNFEKVVIWSSEKTLSKIDDAEWLVKVTHPFLNKSFIWALLFQIFVLKKSAKEFECSLLFVPGGTFLCGFRPFVTLSQNMLPFELKEAFRFESVITRMRFLLLRMTQSLAFRRASGLIFLTQYAKNSIVKILSLKARNITVIHHGIDHRFAGKPKAQYLASNYSLDNPYRLLYVSILTAYKHQWNVAEAVFKLSEDGFPIHLTLIGPKDSQGYAKLMKVFKRYPESSSAVSYLGEIDHDALPNYYKDADAFVFASSCENMPIILVEAMSAGLPIASSNMGPMPEILSAAGIYFNPESVDDIYETLKKLFVDDRLRDDISNKSYSIATSYTWKNCADDSFSFLSKIANIKL